MKSVTSYIKTKSNYINIYSVKLSKVTEFSALSFSDHLTKQTNMKRTPITNYLDLSKAVDTLYRNILLSELYMYDISV